MQIMVDKIYISGKITEFLPEKQLLNEEKFYQAEEFIKSLVPTAKIYNPPKIAKLIAFIYEDPDYKTFLYNTIEYLWRCDAIFMLKNWKLSKGAKAEHAIAEALNLKILYEEEIVFYPQLITLT
jgi:hypothetical protein